MSAVSEVSKNEIVPVKATSFQKNYQHPEHTWVWAEDYLKHWMNNNAVKSAKDAGHNLLPQVGRTKYKVYRYCHLTKKPDVLTSDNSYVEQDFNGKAVAYYWDKKAIKKLVDEAIESYNKENKQVPARRSVMNEYEQTNLLIRELVRKRSCGELPEKSVLVRLDNFPTHYERHDYVAYAPIQGYYISAPELQKTIHGEGYDFHIYFNNKKTEKCSQFVESYRVLKGGIFCGNGSVVTKWEGTTNPFFVHNLINQLLVGEDRSPTTEMLLCDCEWTHTKEKGVPSVEKTVIRRTKTHEEPYKTYYSPNGLRNAGVLKDTYPSKLSDLKRQTFEEELSQKVFHPDRVARFMGDTWGTEDSWLAQVM